MQKTTLRAMTLFTLLTLPPAVLAGSMTYDIQNYPTDQNGWTLSGAITTDGKTGVLAPSDILSWTWTITGGRLDEVVEPIPPIIVNSTDEGAGINATNLEATPTQILLPPGGLLVLVAEVEILGAGTITSITYSRGQQPPFYGTEIQLLGTREPPVDPWSTDNPSMGGTDPWIIASVPTAAVPEPSTLYLLGFGAVCGSVFVMGHKRRERRAATTDG